MAVELKMPKMGLTMSTADVAKWLKNEGETVKKGEPLVEVMTDKLTNQVEAPADGVLLKIAAQPGAKLEAGGLLGFIGQPGEALPESAAAPAAATAAAAPSPAAPAASAAPAAAPAGGRVVATPVAKKMAQEHGLDLSLIAGTGPGGRITKEDVEAALAAGPPPAAPAAGPAAPAPETSDEVAQRKPYSGMRQVIGRNMHRSWAEIPRVTLHTEVAMDKLLALRQQINASAEPMDKVSVTDLMIKLISAAVGKHPHINCLFDGNDIMIMKHVNLGVAVALDEGLVVPVIRRAESKSLKTVSAEMKELAHKAKTGTLSLDDMSGGTLTVSNLGGYGSVDTFNPIINPPQAAIIGLGRSRQIPAIVDGQVVAATVMSISVTHDHRVLDGAPVAAFMGTLNALIADPLGGLV